MIIKQFAVEVLTNNKQAEECFTQEQDSQDSYQKYEQEVKIQSPQLNHQPHLNGLQHEDIISSIRRKIYYSKLDGIPIQKTNRRSRSIRKLTQKALKTLKIKVSTFSKEIQEPKLTVKGWFKKKIEDDDDKERIILKCRDWLQNCISSMDYKQFFQIAQKYIKSEELEFNVNQIKRNPHNQEFAEIPFSTVMQGIPPGSAEHSSQNLALIRLKIPLTYLTKKENSFMTERLYWDLDDEQSESEIFQNLTIILMDLFNETHSQYLKDLLYQEFMVITQICYFQLIVQLENHQKIQSCWRALLDSGFDIHQEPILQDGTIPIQLNLRNQYKEDIQWDTSYNLKQFIIKFITSIDEFSQNLVSEQGLDKKYAILISCQISTQIQKYIEQRLTKLQNIFGILIDQEDSRGGQLDQKIKLNLIYKDNLDLLTCNDFTTKLPQNHELQMFFKKYVEFLPPEISKLFMPQCKNEKVEICIDFDDIKRNENQFNLQLSCNEYMDASIHRELMKGSLNKTLILKL